ncbi:MAG TPA: AgmX/PglI C-terminal domain-containing protein [Polyangiaceae bacterium]
MRSTLLLALVVPVFGLPLACGGGAAATGGGAATVAGGANVNAGGAAATSAPAPTDPGPTTTTTTTLGANNDLQGAKLTTTTTVASTTGSSAPPPKGPHTHEPGRSQADLHAIMTAHRDEARACYDAALPNHPGIQGDLVIQFTIDPKGAVTRVSQDTGRSQITEPGVVGCVVNVIKRIQFAASPGGYETMASFPYNFMPRKAQTTP